MDNEALKKNLLLVGIPASVMHTTLVLQGQQALRDSVMAKVKGLEGADKGYAIFPTASNGAYKARTVFYTLAKECFLARKNVYVTNLISMLDAIVNDDYQNTYQAMNSAQMLFVVDFYEDGAPVPFSGSDGARLRAYIKAYLERGGIVSVLSDKPLASCKGWYPVSFIEVLATYTDAYGIDKGTA